MNIISVRKVEPNDVVGGQIVLLDRDEVELTKRVMSAAGYDLAVASNPHLSAIEWMYTLDESTSSPVGIIDSDGTIYRLDFADEVDKWHLHGKYFGFPDCCIEEFCSPDFVPLLNEPFPLNGTGYVPCKECRKKSVKELVKVIAENRKCPVPFPSQFEEASNIHLFDFYQNEYQL